MIDKLVDAAVSVITFFMGGRIDRQELTWAGHAIQGFFGVFFWSLPFAILFSPLPAGIALAINFGRNMGYWEQREFIVDGLEAWWSLVHESALTRREAGRIVLAKFRADGQWDFLAGVAGGLLAAVLIVFVWIL